MLKHYRISHLLSFIHSQSQLTLFTLIDVVLVHLATFLDLDNILLLLLKLILVARSNLQVCAHANCSGGTWHGYSGI